MWPEDITAFLNRRIALSPFSFSPTTTCVVVVIHSIRQSPHTSRRLRRRRRRHPTRRRSSRLARARTHLSLERALECKKVGKSTENERHRACVRVSTCARACAAGRGGASAPHRYSVRWTTPGVIHSILVYTCTLFTHRVYFVSNK